jgi:N utilization substance protein A
MKSEFILAFNEICESRGLKKDEVIEALKTALVSAYRRDNNVSSMQKIVAEIDPRTGEPSIFAEKEVVEDIFDRRTEVLLENARSSYPDAQLGDLVMVDSTTAAFGRIAAQTAKQVLLQRVREAEREQLYEDFSDREGELVNGTVQSVSGQHLTIGLGRTEAILPKSQQVPGERYRAHDKIRVYVLEVRRTNRGPQIFVSRNHRNLLRRLLELEVPEIYNGQVEIKSIAREAGQRSKVAVQALQPGVDPVGACVGMRGVRIQSIVRELNDEKIDVIEWDSDQKTFIAKALSPARVSHVFLDEDPFEGKTAVVIVPDDQLSLAIGREGQNARLGAKLTGWRIDIKSLTEAAGDSLGDLNNPLADPQVAGNTQLIENVRGILDKKAANRPITSEDYHTLDRMVRGVEGKIIAARSAEHEEYRRQRMEARRSVPEVAWEMPLDKLDLPGRIHNLLLDNKVETVGAVMMVLAMGDQEFLSFQGLGEAALETVKTRIAEMGILHVQPTVEVTEEAEAALMELEEAAAEVDVLEEAAEFEAEFAAVDELETAVSAEQEITAEVEAELEETVEAVAEEKQPEPATDEAESRDVIDDLSQSLVAKPDTDKKESKKGKVVVVDPTRAEPSVPPEPERRGKKKGRQLIYDEDAGEVVVKRKRKGSRSAPTWDNYDMDDEF